MLTLAKNYIILDPFAWNKFDIKFSFGAFSVSAALIAWLCSLEPTIA